MGRATSLPRPDLRRRLLAGSPVSKYRAVQVPRDFHKLVRLLEKECVKLGIWEARGLDTEDSFHRLSLIRESLYKYAEKNLRGRRKDDPDPTHLRF